MKTPRENGAPVTDDEEATVAMGVPCAILT